MAEHDLDVVVFGATGITGRQVCRYLAEQSAGRKFKWAAAARNAAKAESTLSEIGVTAPETIAADVEDPTSLRAMAERTAVVLNLVGPYTLHGRPVIEACVAGGAHYADLTGEIPFVRRMIEEFDAAAREAGVKVVQVCGFEALPPDLAVRLGAETVQERFGEELAEVDLRATMKGPASVMPLSDALSGGTLQSLAAAAADEDAARIMDPAALVTDPTLAEEIRRASPIVLRPRSGGGGQVIAPMAPAAFINPAVIQRSAFLASRAAGSEFRPFTYREGLAMGGAALTTPFRWAAAGAVSGVQAAAGRLSRAGTGTRQRASRVMRRVLPSSGFGPTRNLEDWRWGMTVRARAAGGGEVTVEIEAEGQPGYLTTARMLGEAGLLMAEAGATPDVAGCVTPATALGTAAAPRLEPARVRFSVV